MAFSGWKKNQLLFILTGIVACNTGSSSSIQLSDASTEQNLSQSTGLTISPKKSSGLCLTTTDPKGDNGAAVIIAPCDSSDSQVWSPAAASNSLRLFGNRCLDVVDGINKNGAHLQLWDCFDDNTNQKWKLQGNVWQWGNSGKCLDLTDGRMTAGTAIQIWDCSSDNDNQQWVMAPSKGSASLPVDGVSADENSSATDVPAPILSDSTGYISSGYFPMACLDHPFAKYQGADSNSPWIVQMMSCDYSDAKKFTYRKNGTLIASSGFCLVGDNTVDPLSGQVVLSLQACSESDPAQQWDYVGRSWRNRKSKTCMDLINDVSANYARLHLMPCSGSSSQSWTSIVDMNTKVLDPTANATTLMGRCSPAVVYSFRMDDATKNKFIETIPSYKTILQQAIAADCNYLFAGPGDVPDGLGYMNVVFDQNVAGGNKSGTTVTLGWSVPSSVSPENDAWYMGTIMYHEVGHFYQKGTSNAPSWLIEGMAEAMPRMAGLARDGVQKGGSYKDGYKPTAYFLMYLNNKFPNFIRQLELDLNKIPGVPIDADYFKLKTGKSVDQLWSEYQNSF